MVLALQIVVILAWSESGLRVQDFCDFGILACLCVVLAFKLDVVLAWFGNGFGVEDWCGVDVVCEWFWRYRLL